MFTNIRLAVNSSNISCGLNILSIQEFHIAFHVYFCVFASLHFCALENYLSVFTISKHTPLWLITQGLHHPRHTDSEVKGNIPKIPLPPRLPVTDASISVLLSGACTFSWFISGPLSWPRWLRMAARSIVAEATSFRLAAPFITAALSNEADAHTSKTAALYMPN